MPAADFPSWHATCQAARMDTTSYIALSRQIALQRHITTIATNIANASTTGYRAGHTLFAEVLQRAGEPRRLAFTRDIALIHDLGPGPVESTGNPLDLAIDGPGYFSFATSNGVRYGRGGRLEVEPAGRLVSMQGHPILDDVGNPVILPPEEHSISVAADGTVSGRAGQVGRIGVVSFANEQALQRVGDGLFATELPPLPTTGARLVQGALEGSNVRPVLEMTAMLETVRAFEAVQRLLETQHELDRRAAERIVRASG